MDYREIRERFKELLKLENEPVAIKWSVREPGDIRREEGKSRFCEKLEKAMKGEVFYATADEEECMGGARYTGLRDRSEFPANMRSGAFLTAMGLYRDIPAVQRSWRNNMNIEPGIFQALIFAPMGMAEFEPDVIFLICNARQAMEILHANAYDSGSHGLGADSGPICSSMAALPYLTGKVTYGFGDAGSRRHMDLGDDDVMVSIPGGELPRIVSNLEDMKRRRPFRED